MLYFHSVLGQVSWQATPRLRFTVADAFTHNDQPPEADSLGLRRERATFTSNAFSLSADYLLDRVATRDVLPLEHVLRQRRRRRHRHARRSAPPRRFPSTPRTL